MKLSIAALALAAISTAMGQGIDESCFFMYGDPDPGFGRDRRELAGEHFIANPGDFNTPGGVNVNGVNINCEDHSTIEAAGFEKYDAAAVCDKLIDGAPGMIQCVNTLPTQCGRVDSFFTCPFDIFWTCKEHFLDEDTIVKAVVCATTTGCKVGTAICALDPHFKTWADVDAWYDYHGQCDLKYMSDPNFFLGLGMDIHIRTKGRYDYSYIESAALKLGDDIFELSSYGGVIYNGIANVDVDGIKMADKFLIQHTASTENKETYMVHIHFDQYIELTSFKDMVSVKVQNATERFFGSTVGMMGDFMEGKLISRDGKKVYNIHDQEEVNAFGQEWQVLVDEPNLFQSPSDPTKKCVLPVKRESSTERRLGETSVTEEDAKAACASSYHANICFKDVMATGDIELANAGIY